MKIIRFIAIAVITVLIFAVPAAGRRTPKKSNNAEEVKKAETEYEKLFKDKKYKTAKGFFTIHLTEDGKLIVELPREIVGRDMLITSAVDQTSNGGDAAVGYISPKSIPVSFDVTDSLVLLRERLPFRYSADEQQASAIAKSHIGAVIATFPIKTMSPDSTAYVFDATSYFTGYDKRLDPVDPQGADSFDGLISTELMPKSNLSMLCDVQGFSGNMSILSYETYSMDKSVLGMKSADGSSFLTVLQRRSLLLLPEKLMSPRIADSRIGVRAGSRKVFGDRGSKTAYFADRWRLDDGESVVFYIDTLFDARMASAISAGILKWNEAFAGIGRDDVVKVLPYPSDDPEFDANDLRYSCVKYEMDQNTGVRSNTWLDPRSGEILSATVYVPFDVLNTIHSKMFFEIGAAEPSVRRVNDNGSDVIYEGLQAEITRAVGSCLGLENNLAGSYAVPVDSLRSPSFTGKYGLSGSIMDIVPYNFAAVEGDRERGVRLVHTELGEYDKYVVKWLYCNVPGAQDPADEVPYLDNLIDEARRNPYCLYVRRPQSRIDPRYSMDPRIKTDDLGNDEIKSAKLRLDNARYVVSHMSEWLRGQDPEFRFRLMLNVRFVENSFYVYADLMKNLGGFYLSEIKDGDGIPSYSPVPAEVQKNVMRCLLEEISDMSWLDATDAYRDLIFVRSFADYIQTMSIDQLMGNLSALGFAQEKYDSPYSMMDAYDDIMDCVLKNVKAGRLSAMENRIFQYVLLSYALSVSNVASSSSGRASSITSDSREFMMQCMERNGFAPMTELAFRVPEVYEHQFYSRLLDIRKIYAQALRTVKDESIKQQYEYFIMAIDRALKID